MTAYEVLSNLKEIGCIGSDAYPAEDAGSANFKVSSFGFSICLADGSFFRLEGVRNILLLTIGRNAKIVSRNSAGKAWDLFERVMDELLVQLPLT